MQQGRINFFKKQPKNETKHGIHFSKLGEMIKTHQSILAISSVQSLSCVQLCNPMDYSTPGFAVHHQLPDLAQTHVHRVSDAIQPSHPLSSPSPPTFNLSRHQGLFK